MNIDTELAENVCILADRLKCIIKILSENHYNTEEQFVIKNLAEEFAYNINVETQNIFNKKTECA